MAEILVLDWIEEFDSLTESEIHTYAMDQEHNHEVMIAVYIVLEEFQSFKKGILIGKICRQLLGFYRSGESHLCKFAMQYIPHLIWLHLSDKKAYPEVEILLVSLYNLEVVDGNGQHCIKSFRVPSIAQSSLYHDSACLEPAFIAENSLRRWEECNTKLVNWGPLPQVESLNAQNRQRVMTALLFLYNQQVGSICLQGIDHTCRAISKFVSQGFHSGGARTSSDSDSIHQMAIVPRLIVSNPLLLELLHIVYHSLKRGANAASQALHDITYRATYEAYADVLLATHAVHNLLHRSPTAYLPARPINTQHVSKSMITNASFRTKKLPDDIPMQDEESEGNLESIMEEGQEWTDKNKFRGRTGSALKHLPKLPGLNKKLKARISSNTPKHGLETDQAVEMRMAGGDQVSLIAGNFPENSNDINHMVHVSTV